MEDRTLANKPFWRRLKPGGRDKSKYRWMRRYVLLETFLWAAAGAAFGTYAMWRINRERDRFLNALPNPNDVNYDNRTIRLPGVMTSVGCYLVVILSFSMLVCTFFTRSSLDRQMTQSVVLGFFAFWLVMCVSFETGYYATSRARIKGTINGIQINGTTIQDIENRLGIKTTYRSGSAYLLVAIICSWFAWLWTTIATVVIGMTVPETVEDGAAAYSRATESTITRNANDFGRHSEKEADRLATAAAPVGSLDAEARTEPRTDAEPIAQAQ